MSFFRHQLFAKYNATATLTYGIFSGETTLPKPVTTSGSSTSITAVTAGDGPFNAVGVGDELHVDRDGTHDVVYITAIADEDNATVETAVDWEDGPRGETAGRHARLRRFLSGTTDDDGWFSVHGNKSVKIQFIVSTINATSITFSVQGRIAGSQQSPTDITSSVFTATGSDYVDLQPLDADWDEVRVGVQVTGDTGAQDVSAYALGT